MKLGVVACLHGNLKKARKLASKFKKSDIDAIALAGDIAADAKQKQSLTKILKLFLQTGKLILVTPGNHEQYDAYYGAMKVFSKNKSVVDCTKNPKVKIGSQKLVFLPGSGVGSAPGAGFRQLPSRKLMKRFKLFLKGHKSHFWGKVTPVFLGDYAKLLDKDTVVINHSPIKFSTKNAIDVAVFAEPTRPFMLSKEHQKLDKTTKSIVFKPGHVAFTLDEYAGLKKAGYPITLSRKNVGDRRLRELLKKKGVTKFICGDIHEAGGRANNWRGKSIKPGKWSTELFYNCSPGTKGRAGIVEFSGDLARYRNIKV